MSIDEAMTTKERIMSAALETLRDEGIVEASARVIAAKGGFNQALIFYHFGSVNNLLMQAAARSSAAQVAHYREAAAGARSLIDLVDTARQLHADDQRSGSVTVVTQLMAASVSDPEMGKAVLDGFLGWIELVQDSLAEALDGSPLASMIPVREAAYAIAAVFLGIELMERLDPERSEANQVFTAMASVAQLVEGFVKEA